MATASAPIFNALSTVAINLSSVSSGPLLVPVPSILAIIPTLPSTISYTCSNIAGVIKRASMSAFIISSIVLLNLSIPDIGPYLLPWSTAIITVLPVLLLNICPNLSLFPTYELMS